MTTISTFISTFRTDVARTNKFDVSIPVPSALVSSGSWTGVSELLSFRCESAQLPSRSFSTANQRFGSNPIEQHPYHTDYNESQMTFIVSGDMTEKYFFDAWMEAVNPSYTFDFTYKDTYVTDMTVYQYDTAGNLTYSTTFIDAYPKIVNQLDLDWSTDSYHKLTVQFAYTSWINNIQKYNNSQLSSPTTTSQNSFY